MSLWQRSKRNSEEIWRRYKRSRAAFASLMVLLAIIMLAIIGPLLTPYGPFGIVGSPLLPPSLQHPFGTDDIGRDVFSQLVYGARISLLIASLATLTSLSIGVVIGVFAGFFGGKTDALLMRVTELFQVVPRFFLALTLIAVFGTTIWNIIIVIGLTSWPRAARLVRAEFLSLRTREFVDAARVLGSSNLNLMFDEILPNAMPPVIISASLEIGNAITLESGLSFLGLGDPRAFSWGRMLGNAQPFLRVAWWMAVFPGLAIAFTVLALNLIGDGLNDALNPKLREGR
jgi:peptide/nickel transport system permease protein